MAPLPGCCGVSWPALPSRHMWRLYAAKPGGQKTGVVVEYSGLLPLEAGSTMAFPVSNAFQMLSIRSRRAALLPICIALAVGLCTLIAHHVGQSDGAVSRQRLEIVWPNFMQLRDQDRALLASLALSCHLQDRDEDRASVLECLKDAVMEDATLPNSMDRKQAKDRLDQLIAGGA